MNGKGSSAEANTLYRVKVVKLDLFAVASERAGFCTCQL